MNYLKLISLAPLVMLAALAAAQTEKPIDQKDVETIVRELEAHATPNAEYAYPIKIEFLTDDVLNAAAHLTKPAKEGDKPQATVTVYKKFTDFMGNDRRLLRAVLAHEVSHLSRGHVSHRFTPADLSLIFTRQQEMDADAQGAALLVRCGYPKQDMVDFLNFAEARLRGGASWVAESLADHPSFDARVANIQDNPLVARSMAEFDYGLMFMESRQFVPAAAAFKRVIEKQPDLIPAYVNVGQALLQYYYENRLPQGVRDSWFRADFGGMLTSHPAIGAPKGDDMAKAIAAYREAVTAIDAALAKDPSNPRGLELKALSQVLDPQGDAATLRTGAEALEKIYGSATLVPDKLRAANNAALGYTRAGDSKKATSLLMQAQTGAKDGESYSVSLIMASNIARTKVDDIDESARSLAATVILYYLSNTPDTDANWATGKSEYTAICQKANFKIEEVKPAATIYCTALSLSHKGTELSLLSPIDDFIGKYGKPMNETVYDQLYDGMKELIWDSNQLTVITEGDKAIRVTSFSPDASLTLHSIRPNDDTTVVIHNGMTMDEVGKLIDSKLSVTVNLVHTAQAEQWLYYPNQGFGLKVGDDKKVCGITVTPANFE